jgi:hypothetical protein
LIAPPAVTLVAVIAPVPKVSGPTFGIVRVWVAVAVKMSLAVAAFVRVMSPPAWIVTLPPVDCRDKGVGAPGTEPRRDTAAEAVNETPPEALTDPSEMAPTVAVIEAVADWPDATTLSRVTAPDAALTVMAPPASSSFMPGVEPLPLDPEMSPLLEICWSRPLVVLARFRSRADVDNVPELAADPNENKLLK